MDGCLEYTRTTVELFFPKDGVRCALCPLMQTYSRKQCMRTGELIADDRGRGYFCPLVLDETEETT